MNATKCSHVLHERVKRDSAAWRALPLVGVQRFGRETYELRNHTCGSTLAKEIES